MTLSAFRFPLSAFRFPQEGCRQILALCLQRMADSG